MTEIRLPWPGKELFPNFKRRHHWTAYHKQVAAYRKVCGWLTKQSRTRPDIGLVPMTITFYPPDRRRRDDDGVIGAFKSGRDGLADAWGIDDNAFRPTYRFAEPVKDGLVVVTLTN